ncbi:hypothetical protein N568_0106355 [Lactococcus garvieae TRF1]|uniref:Uncharacterized protein n=1 Tax=Lactococcus garvieae TRF1 TaxID=1380772 RepID=V8AQ39_9LACT|nr:hypothetical protein N568_0106355 [Lactococcus garvieae TRF1]
MQLSSLFEFILEVGIAEYPFFFSVRTIVAVETAASTLNSVME